MITSLSPKKGTLFRMAKRSRSRENIPPQRFDFSSEDNDFEDFQSPFVPKTTASDTKKCIRLFEEWAQERNKVFTQDQVPEDILLSNNTSELVKWLCKFCSEVRKKDCSPYPPKNIHHYLMSIQRYIRLSKGNSINLITDGEFVQLKNLLDALYRKLHSQGIGCSVRKTEVLSDDDEEKLWISGVLNPDTPQGLMNCVFFLNGRNFCLIGGIEQRELKFSQLVREVVNVDGKLLVRYTYTEH